MQVDKWPLTLISRMLTASKLVEHVATGKLSIDSSWRDLSKHSFTSAACSTNFKAMKILEMRVKCHLCPCLNVSTVFGYADSGKFIDPNWDHGKKQMFSVMISNICGNYIPIINNKSCQIHLIIYFTYLC